MFAERPFNDVWIEAVADEAGVSRGLIYHYFPNKRDFFAAIVRHGVDDTFERTAPDESLPPEQRLPASIERFLDWVEANEDAFRAVHRGRHSVDVEIQAVVQDGREHQIGRIAEIISPGEPVSPVVRMAIEGWINFLDNSILSWLDERSIPRDQLIELLSGAMSGIVAAALVCDGQEARIETLSHLRPAHPTRT